MLTLTKAYEILKLVKSEGIKLNNIKLIKDDKFSYSTDGIITIQNCNFEINSKWYKFMIEYLKKEYNLDSNVYMFYDFLETFSFLHEVGHARQGLDNDSKYDDEYFLYKNTVYISYEDAFKTYRELTLEKDADNFAVSFIKRHKFEIWAIMNDISIAEAIEEYLFWNDIEG